MNLKEKNPEVVLVHAGTNNFRRGVMGETMDLVNSKIQYLAEVAQIRSRVLLLRGAIPSRHALSYALKAVLQHRYYFWCWKTQDSVLTRGSCRVAFHPKIDSTYSLSHCTFSNNYQ